MLIAKFYNTSIFNSQETRTKGTVREPKACISTASSLHFPLRLARVSQQQNSSLTMASSEAHKMNLKFLLSTDACDAASSSSGEIHSPYQLATATVAAAIVPGSPVSQKGMADFVRVPVSKEYQICEQYVKWPAPPVLCDSNIGPLSQVSSPCVRERRLQSWPVSLTAFCRTSDEVPRSPNRYIAELLPTAIPGESVAASHRSSHQTLGSQLSAMKIPKASLSIRRHGREKESDFKTHTCFCGRAFNKREHLKRHNLLVHQELRPFTCNDCDLHFGTKQNYQVHMSTRKHRQRVLFQRAVNSGNG